MPSLVRGELVSVERTTPRFESRHKRLNPMQAAGLRYEKKCRTALDVLAKSIGGRVEHGSWFKYVDANGPHICQPDHILFADDDTIIVVETKTTWVPVADPKLKALYVPVVRHLFHPSQIGHLVLCKNLSSGVPDPISGFIDCFKFSSVTSVYHWTEIGPLRWNL